MKGSCGVKRACVALQTNELLPPDMESRRQRGLASSIFGSMTNRRFTGSPPGPFVCCFNACFQFISFLNFPSLPPLSLSLGSTGFILFYAMSSSLTPSFGQQLSFAIESLRNVASSFLSLSFRSQSCFYQDQFPRFSERNVNFSRNAEIFGYTLKHIVKEGWRWRFKEIVVVFLSHRRPLFHCPFYTEEIPYKKSASAQHSDIFWRMHAYTHTNQLSCLLLRGRQLLIQMSCPRDIFCACLKMEAPPFCEKVGPPQKRLKFV